MSKHDQGRAQSRSARRLLSKPLTARRAARMIAAFTLLVTLTSGTLGWLLDREDFPTLGTGLWWALQTVTTVGYGDVTPQHTEGRVIAALAMLAGIGFLAVITASVTATFVENARSRYRRSADREIAQELRQINARLTRIEERQREARREG